MYVAISVTSDESIAKKLEASADTVILDSMNKETGARGGTGKTHDWSINRRCAVLPQYFVIPVSLLGTVTQQPSTVRVLLHKTVL
jgi:phosphoribosylanthranilate isomerase